MNPAKWIIAFMSSINDFVWISAKNDSDGFGKNHVVCITFPSKLWYSLLSAGGDVLVKHIVLYVDGSGVRVMSDGASGKKRL